MNEKNIKKAEKTMRKPYEMTQFENFKNDPFGYVFMGCYTKQNLAKQKEIDRYSLAQPNQLMQAMYKCKTLTQKIFTLIVQEFLNRKDFSDKPVSLDLLNVTKAFTPYNTLKTTNGKKRPLKQMYVESIEELRKLALTYQDENNYHAINLFDEVKFQWEWGTFKFWLSPKFRHMLELGQKHGITIFNIDTIAPMKSFYAIRFFQIAMSYYGFKGKSSDNRIKNFFEQNNIDIKSSWWFAYTYQELRLLFKIKDNEYARKDVFIRTIIDNPISEINEIQSRIKIQVFPQKLGREIIGWIFVCTEKAEQLKISKSDTKQIKDEKRAINSEQEEMAQLKAKYPQEWQEIFEQEMKNPILFGGEEFKKTTAESYTFQKIKENHAKKQKIQP